MISETACHELVIVQSKQNQHTSMY